MVATIDEFEMQEIFEELASSSRRVSSLRELPSSAFTSISSADDDNPQLFWETPPRVWRQVLWGYQFPQSPGLFAIGRSVRRHLIMHIVFIRLIIVLVFISALFVFFIPRANVTHDDLSNTPHAPKYRPIRPEFSSPNKRRPDPLKWLDEHSNNQYSVLEGNVAGLGFTLGSRKPRAALISLVRNQELEGLKQSMQQLEYRWNRKYQYPWVFFNDEPFSDEFKAATQNLTLAECYYEVVPREHWSLPEWVDEERFINSLEYLGTIGVGKGWMVSYHHMCRWNSGFFYKHPRLADFDWYWRIEPNVHYFCDVDYDVFRFMRDNDLKYGFNINILDDARSFPSLWLRTNAFIAANSHLIHPEADLNWLLDPQNNGEYNNCQFFSNFEIGSLNFWRGEANEKYFDWLDKGGGFFYERFGDAPVHTLSVAMFLSKSEIWFFRDIGYQHDVNLHCPPNSRARCSCEPTSIDENFYKLVPQQSPQIKPQDTCIRQFLGGEWLKKKDGWTSVAEKNFGGDGYHGYEIWDLTNESATL